MISLTTSRDIMRNARAKQLCLTLAAAAPFLDVSRLMPATCMGTWFFVVDELTDEHGLTSSAQWGKLVGLHALFSPGRQDAIDTQGDERLAPLLEALSDLRGLLRQYPIFETLSPELARALEEGLSGMPGRGALERRLLRCVAALVPEPRGVPREGRPADHRRHPRVPVHDQRDR
ncbi:hypothetical protein ACN28I_00110 [Archangium gephyra]|uniref:hypothetical protein n=1 Tax=Archangium gephyra TaxID=48 RepID=UPI003B7ACC30